MLWICGRNRIGNTPKIGSHWASLQSIKAHKGALGGKKAGKGGNWRADTNWAKGYLYSTVPYSPAETGKGVFPKQMLLRDWLGTISLFVGGGEWMPLHHLFLFSSILCLSCFCLNPWVLSLLLFLFSPPSCCGRIKQKAIWTLSFWPC